MNFSTNYVTIGHERIEVKPLTLENALSLILLLSPHISLIETKWPEIKQALNSTNGKRPQLLRAIFLSLRDEMTMFPGDVTRAFALLLDRDLQWTATHASAEDFVNALPVLDNANNFIALWKTAKSLGLSVKYG